MIGTKMLSIFLNRGRETQRTKERRRKRNGKFRSTFHHADRPWFLSWRRRRRGGGIPVANLGRAGPNHPGGGEACNVLLRGSRRATRSFREKSVFSLGLSKDGEPPRERATSRNHLQTGCYGFPKKDSVGCLVKIYAALAQIYGDADGRQGYDNNRWIDVVAPAGSQPPLSPSIVPLFFFFFFFFSYVRWRSLDPNSRAFSRRWSKFRSAGMIPGAGNVLSCSSLSLLLFQF